MTESLLSEYIARYHDNRIAEFVRFATEEIKVAQMSDTVERGKVRRWLDKQAIIKHNGKKFSSIYVPQLMIVHDEKSEKK